MLKRLLVLSLVLVLGGLVSLGAQSPCIGDDGLAGNCYQPAQAKLPKFPALKSTALWVPWLDCKPVKVQKAVFAVPAPQPVACGIYLLKGVDFRVANGTLPLWDPSATWFMFYTRTWMETVPGTTTRYQVWRFLINAEVPASSQILSMPPNDALAPRCVYKHKVAHYWGFLDYAVNCKTGAWYIAFGVNHMCDVFTHNGWAKYPGTYHPNWAYTAVAPGNFLPDPAQPGVGGLQTVYEAFRTNRLSKLPLCETEQDIQVGAVLVGQQRRCSCGSQPGLGKQYIEFRTRASTKCKSQALSIYPFPVLWGNSVQMSVGAWDGTTGVYPGKEQLYFLVDPMWYWDGGAGGAQTGQLFYGVGTLGGFPAFLFKPGTNPVRQFLDYGSVQMLPYFWVPFAGMAGWYVSLNLIYLNF